MCDTCSFHAPCRFCARPVMPPISADHAEDCPVSTGIYPVLVEDVVRPCPCGQHSCIIGLRCAECGTELKVGDHYSYLPVPGRDYLGMVVCLFCAATKEEATIE